MLVTLCPLLAPAKLLTPAQLPTPYLLPTGYPQHAQWLGLANVKLKNLKPWRMHTVSCMRAIQGAGVVYTTIVKRWGQTTITNEMK